MQVVPVPIMVPSETRRDCIVVDNHTYCREEQYTPHEIGIVLIIVIILATWILIPIEAIIGYDIHARWAIPWYGIPLVSLIIFLLTR